MNDEQELTAEAEAKTEPTKPIKPRRTSNDDPAGYKGGRRVTRQSRCGWCMDDLHEKCKHEIAHFDKLSICACDCNNDWTPRDLGSGEIIDTPRPAVEDLDSEDDDETQEPAASKPHTVRRKTTH